jgi:hypothetical protein
MLLVGEPLLKISPHLWGDKRIFIYPLEDPLLLFIGCSKSYLFELDLESLPRVVLEIFLCLSFLALWISEMEQHEANFLKF